MAEGMSMMDENELSMISGGAYTGSVFLYTVRPGDNFLTLSRRFNTTVSILQELNPDLKSISSGIRILVPLST